MAKYLNSTGVSLLWNKIKELILDKIGSIVPFVYVSTDGPLAEKYRNHNLNQLDAMLSNRTIKPYIVFCSPEPNYIDIGAKLFISRSEENYLAYFYDENLYSVDCDFNTGDMQNSLDTELHDELYQTILRAGFKHNSYDYRINIFTVGDEQGSFESNVCGTQTIIKTIYIPKSSILNSRQIEHNWGMALESMVHGRNSADYIIAQDSGGVLSKFPGYILYNKIYVLDIENKLFEVYEITETATTRIDDIPFSGIKDYTSGLMFNVPLKYLNTSVEIFTGDGSVPPTVNNNKFIINNKRLQNIHATFKNLNDTTYKDILNNIYGVESINGKNCIATLKITLQDSGQGTLSYNKESDLISVTSGTPIIICHNGSKDELVFDNHNYEVEIIDITYYNDAITDILLNKKIRTVEKLNETIKYINKLYIDKFSEYYNKENIDLMFSKQDTDNINKRISSNFPVKMSYDVTSSTMTFETDRQLFTIEVTGTPIVEKQYVTGYATGNLVIANGVTASVDKNGKFKREFTTNFPTFNNCKEVTHIYANGINMNKIKYLRHIFKNCSNLVEVNVSDWDISNVIQADRLFDGCSKLTNIDVSKWNTSKLTDIQDIFSWCSNLEHIDVSNWNVSNITNFSVSFAGCEKLEEIDISKWNTTKATTFFAMFESCLSLKSLDFNTWTTTNVTNISEMFYECKSLTTLDLSSFDTSKVTTMSEMFYDCNNLQTLGLGTNWYMDKVTNASGMFDRCFNLTSVSGDIFGLKQSLNLKDCPLDNISAMVFINGIAENGNGVNLTFKKSTYDTLTTEQKAIATSKGATINYI